MKILIIKFAALGDVLRTTPLLPALKKKYRDSHISWLTEKASADILNKNKFIDELYLFNEKSLKGLSDENFDILINLDKDKEAMKAAECINAKVKMGFGQNKDGSLRPFNKESEYATRLGIDDELKFKKNKKTYQEISFEQAGLIYNGEEYIFSLDEKDIEYVKKKLAKSNLRNGSVKIGIATGSGSGFCAKALPEDYYIKIVELLNRHDNIQTLLLGGLREAERNSRILKAVKSKVIDTGCNNSIGQYAAIIDVCDLVLTGDTLTLHLAIALKKLVVVFFGSTAEQEINLYGRGCKLSPSIECSPCYKKACPKDEECLKQITPKRVTDEIIKSLKQNGKI